MHHSLPQWHRDMGTMSLTPNPWKWKGGRRRRVALCVQIQALPVKLVHSAVTSFHSPSVVLFMFLFQFPFPAVVVLPIFHPSALHKPLTTCEWQRQWWELQPRKPPTSATWECQSGNGYPPKIHEQQTQISACVIQAIRSRSSITNKWWVWTVFQCI